MENGCDFNIAVFHHPLHLLNEEEAEEIESILKTQNFKLVFFGHTHKNKTYQIHSPSGGYINLNGRSAFNDTTENNSTYQPGYNFIELDIRNSKYTISLRKFIKERYKFDWDVESADGGKFVGKFPKKENVELSEESNNKDVGLPNGYSADVNRIVKLLIGDSLYPDKFLFVRELIQNSVDACNRIKEKYNDADPQIKIQINTAERYFEVQDDGDGMSRRILREHFSVVGKSISQELYNSNTISKFGIGFISTFIVAKKVVIKTKFGKEEPVQFEVNNVFEGFNYIDNNLYPFNMGENGTIVRVYLKDKYTANVFHIVRTYCRHIKNLFIYVDNVEQFISESWNVENGLFQQEQNTSRYQLKLVIGENPISLIASNSGFLINDTSTEILPYRFPKIIGGEVIFLPGAIDLDISRTKILESPKSAEFRKNLAPFLKRFFRKVLESNNEQLKQTVCNYLQYYLSVVTNESSSFINDYEEDFYTLNELETLCLDYIIYPYEQNNRTLREIFNKLNNSGINTIYYFVREISYSYKNLIVDYLSATNSFVFEHLQTSVFVKEGHVSVSNLQTIHILALKFGVQVIEINDDFAFDKLNLEQNSFYLPEQIVEAFKHIEAQYQVRILTIRFNDTAEDYIKFNTTYYINFNSSNLQNLISQVGVMSSESLSSYLLGYLKLTFKFGPFM